MVVIDNKLAWRIRVLADKNHQTFNQQLELIVEAFEIMNIERVSILPDGPGCHVIPLVEVSGQVIQARSG
jgi:hypothetical protein